MNYLFKTRYIINFCGKFLNIHYINKNYPSTISINATLKPAPTKTIVFFQFYREFKPHPRNRWVIDSDPNDCVPYYSSSDLWGSQWSDGSTYDLCSKGSIIFNTFIGIPNKSNVSCPKQWSYEILCGFSWGMMSKDGVSVEPVPIKPLSSERLNLLAALLRNCFPKGKFIISERCSCIFY